MLLVKTVVYMDGLKALFTNHVMRVILLVKTVVYMDGRSAVRPGSVF